MCSVPGGQHSGLSRCVLRVWAVALATALLLAWVSTARAVAATLKVNTTADETTSGDGLCSLREAIAAANSPGTASDCGTADSVSNTIVLGAGTYTLSIAPTGADDNTTGDLNVTGTTPLEIIGAGATATVINATSLGDRVLSVAAGATVTLQGLTITGGHAPDGAAGADGANGTGTGGPGGPGGAGSAGADGGGILNLGTLTLTDAAVTNSRAGQGGAGGNGGNGAKYGAGGPGGAGGAGGAGGGIYSSGNLTLSHVAMSNNSAGSGGQRRLRRQRPVLRWRGSKRWRGRRRGRHLYHRQADPQRRRDDRQQRGPRQLGRSRWSRERSASTPRPSSGAGAVPVGWAGPVEGSTTPGPRRH